MASKRPELRLLAFSKYDEHTRSTNALESASSSPDARPSTADSTTSASSVSSSSSDSVSSNDTSSSSESDEIKPSFYKSAHW